MIKQNQECEIDKNQGFLKCLKAPTLNVTDVDYQGRFSLNFSEPVNILQLVDSNITRQT